MLEQKCVRVRLVAMNITKIQSILNPHTLKCYIMATLYIAFILSWSCISFWFPGCPWHQPYLCVSTWQEWGWFCAGYGNLCGSCGKGETMPYLPYVENCYIFVHAAVALLIFWHRFYIMHLCLLFMCCGDKVLVSVCVCVGVEM